MEHSTECRSHTSSAKLTVVLVTVVYQVFLLVAVSAAVSLSYWIAARLGINPDLPPLVSLKNAVGVIALSFLFTAALPEPIAGALNETGIIQDLFDAVFIVRFIAVAASIQMLIASIVVG